MSERSQFSLFLRNVSRDGLQYVVILLEIVFLMSQDPYQCLSWCVINILIHNIGS